MNEEFPINQMEADLGKEKFNHYEAVIVSPGYEENEHRTGLHWDTRFRLLAAAEMYKNGYAEKIIVGGARIREMKESFAELMKRELVNKYGIPAQDIITEEFTFDTSSQIEWMNRYVKDKNVAFITDPEQKHHAGALMEGWDTEKDILTTEEIIAKLKGSKRFQAFFEKLHKSPYWLKWSARERVVTYFTKKLDPKGKIIRKITTERLK